MTELTIGNGVFELKTKIGEGAFGQIYYGVNKKDGKEVAVKLEQKNSKHPQLFYEAKIINYLYHNHVHNQTKDDSGLMSNRFGKKEKQKPVFGIPQIYYCFTEGEYNVMVMDVLGPSLEDLYQVCNKKFTAKTILILLDMLIKRIEYIHSRGFIHRDIKPDNFVMGVNQTSNSVFVIDFGLSKRYLRRNGQHIKYQSGKSLTGTARYASINTHLGIEQSRRDDLECLGYVMLYLLTGGLPWQGLRGNDRMDKYERIQEKKLSTAIEDLC